MQKPHNTMIAELFHCAKTSSPDGNQPKTIVFFFTLCSLFREKLLLRLIFHSCFGLSLIVSHTWHLFPRMALYAQKTFNLCIHNLRQHECGCSPTHVLSSCASCNPADGQRQRISPWTSSQPYWQWAREHVLESSCNNTKKKHVWHLNERGSGMKW